MDFPNTIDPEVVLGVKAAAIFIALTVFWPREGRNRQYTSRVITFLWTVGIFAGLTVWDPSELLKAQDEETEVGLIAWVTCEEGQAPWCMDVSQDNEPLYDPDNGEPMKAASAT